MTARKDASRIYTPLLVITNLIYVCLLLGGDPSALYPSRWHWAGALAAFAEQVYSYVGILDHAATHASSNSKDLVGGSHLDVLAITIAVQLLSVLHSPKWLWIALVVVPLLGAYQLYGAVYGSSESGAKPAAAPPTTNVDARDDPAAARRQRRAEKRRQKWG